MEAHLIVTLSFCYFIYQVLQLLISHTTTEMENSSKQKTYDVVIVGSGIMGSSAAYYLSKNSDQNVLLLEQFDFLHKRGSSVGDSRIIRMSYTFEPYASLMRDAFAFWKEAEEDFGSKVLTMTGGIDFGFKNNTSLEKILKSGEEHNVTLEVLTPFQVRERFPLNLPDDYMAIYSPEGGVLNANKAVNMMQILARKYGATLMDNIRVENVIKENDDLLKVVTSQGEFLTKKVIIAPGSWAKKVIGNIANLDLQLKMTQATVGYYKASNPPEYSPEKFPVFIHYDEPRFYGSPAYEFPNMIKCAVHGGPQVFDPDNRDFVPDLAKIKKFLVSELENKFKGIDPEPVHTETCLLTDSPDDHFAIDFLPDNDKIIVACGFSGHGFKLAPVVGKILAGMATTGENPYPFTKPYFSIDKIINKNN